MFKFEPCIIGCKPPVDFVCGFITWFVPCRDFFFHLFNCRNTLLQPMVYQYIDFYFCCRYKLAILSWRYAPLLAAQMFNFVFKVLLTVSREIVFISVCANVLHLSAKSLIVHRSLPSGLGLHTIQAIGLISLPLLYWWHSRVSKRGGRNNLPAF